MRKANVVLVLYTYIQIFVSNFFDHAMAGADLSQLIHENLVLFLSTRNKLL